MLKVLLRVTSGVLKRNPPKERYLTLGGRLAQPIFQVFTIYSFIFINSIKTILQNCSFLILRRMVIYFFHIQIKYLCTMLSVNVYEISFPDVCSTDIEFDFATVLSKVRQLSAEGSYNNIHVINLIKQITTH